MISEGAFWQSVNEVKILSNKLQLKSEYGRKKGVYSPSFLSNMYSDEYRKIYDCIIENGDFEILLKDESLFQFSFSANSYSLAFYPRPGLFISFDEWLSTMFAENSNFKPEEFEKFKEEMIADGDTNSEYEQFLIESDTTQTIIPIRFDYDKGNYSALYHPLCHLHIGLNNHIRIAVDKFLTPLMFFHFITKNYFPDHFFYRDRNNFIHVSELITLKNKDSCVMVPRKNFNNENLLLHIT